MAHLNKLKRSSNLGKYKTYTTVEEILEGIAETKEDQTGIFNYIMSWHNASIDRTRWPDVRLVTTKTLFNNAKDVAEWIGVSGEDLEPFSALAYNPSSKHPVNITGLSGGSMKEVLNVFESVTTLVSSLENGGGAFQGKFP